MKQIVLSCSWQSNKEKDTFGMVAKKEREEKKE